MEVSAFMTEQLREQLREQRDHDETLRQEAKAERVEFEERLAQQAQETERLRAEVSEAKEHAAVVVAVAALQLRMQTLHASKLLTDDELYSLEDTIVDSIEVASGSGTAVSADGSPLLKMVAISQKVADEAMFARQLRRKFV